MSEEDEACAGALALVRPTLERIHAGAMKDGVQTSLSVGIVGAWTYNAFATVIGNTDVIGINIDVSFISFLLFKALLSHHFFLPEVGNPELCEPQVFNHLYVVPAQAGDWPDVSLGCPERTTMAMDLARFVTMHVGLHELGHLSHGHIEFKAKVDSPGVFSEHGASAMSALTSQTLEYDADAFSTEWLLRVLLLPKHEPTDRGSRWHFTGPFQYGDFNRTLGMTTILAAAGSYLLSERENFEIPNESSRRHPPSLIRVQHTLGMIVTALYLRAGMDHESTSPIFTPFLAQYIRALRTTFPMIYWPVPFDGTVEVSGQYLTGYKDEWARIRPELEQFKRGGRLAPALDPAGPF